MNINAVVASDRGLCRESNEDHYLIDESLGLYIVCDGMGGHAAGEVAAERSVAFAADFIRDRRNLLENAAESPDGYFRVMKLAEDATQEASRRLYELACSDSAFAGMGTTMTMLLAVDNKAIMAHVGDSRLYMLRRDELHQLSTDHTLANELLQAGGLTPEEAANSRYAHVLTRTIGQQELVHVESLLFDLFPGDTCLICSDGLSNYFDDRTTVTEFLADDNLAEIPDRMTEFANSHGGADNITLIVLRAMSETEDTGTTDIEHRINTLKSTFLCRELPISRLMRVLNVTSLIQCAAGQELLTAGQTYSGMYVVLEGRLAIEDDEKPFGDLVAGDVVGASSLLQAGRVHRSIVAQEPSRLILLARSKFERLIRRLPKLGNALLSNLGRHLSEKLDDSVSSGDVDPGDTGIWEAGMI